MRRSAIALCVVLSSCGVGSSPPGAPPRASDARADARPVSVGESPATPRIAAYARLVHARFSAERALRTVAYADRFFRVRGNHGYQKTLERVHAELSEEGFAGDDLALVPLGPVQPTWTPRSASLELVTGPSPGRLIAFADESETDRATLLVGSGPMAPRELEVVRQEAVEAGADARGKLVLADGDPRRLFAPLVERTGAVGILVRSLEPYHQPDRFPDVAQFGYLPPHAGSAVGFSLSQRNWERLRAATEAGSPVMVRVAVDVGVGSSAATAVSARIPGRDAQAGAIVFVAHVDEPGANDNGSGVGALTELARALRAAIEAGDVPRPRRALVFLIGQEMEVSQRWLDAESTPPAAGLVLDMVGQDPEAVGAPFLIERMPDPGAIWPRGAADEHTEWGASEVDEGALRGHFLNDLMAASASEVEALAGPWRWRSHPYEGGSDHAPFLERGLPAVLGWHFTDSAYHTSADRIDRVSAEEMRRVAATFGAVALTMAGGLRDDALEVLRIVERAGRARLRDLEVNASDARVRDAWRAWYGEALSSVRAVEDDGAVLLELEAAQSRWTSARRGSASRDGGERERSEWGISVPSRASSFERRLTPVSQAHGRAVDD